GRVAGSDKNAKKDFWDIAAILIGLVGPIATAVVVAWLGWLTKDTGDKAIQKQQLEINSAQAMESLFTKLRNPKVQPDEAETAALTLSAFGMPAISLLVYELRFGSDNARIGAEKGLVLAAVNHHDETCGAL